MMRFNNEYERVSDASFLFFFFFSLELVRPRGVVVVQFVQFRFKYRGFCVSFLSRCQLSVGAHKKNEKTREIFPPFLWRGGKRHFLCFLIRKNWSLAGSLFGCFARERESGQKTLKSLEERKSCSLNAQNAT